MDQGLTPEQIEGLEGMISRRMTNSGETREQSCAQIQRYFRRNPVLYYLKMPIGLLYVVPRVRHDNVVENHAHLLI